jgi:predicted Zn-dependent protease
MMTGKHLRKWAVLGTAIVACSTVLGQTDEEKVGRAAAAQVLGAAPLIRAEAAQQYVGLVGMAVAANSATNYKWRFGVFRSDAVNAFAMPGGYVLLSSGLLKMLDSEDELAFVLAHEVAHVQRRHHYQVVLRQRLADQASKNLSSVVQDSDTAKLAQASGQIYARGLDKSAEFEADRLGVELMTRSGYDPAAAVTVLEKMQTLKGNDPRAELLFSTHPSPAERLDALLQSGIDGLPRPSAESLGKRESRFKQFRSAL